MKFVKKMLLATSTLALVSTSFAMNPISFSEMPVVQAVTENTQPSLMSLGGTLNPEQAEMTKQLLGAQDVTAENTIWVDGVMVNHYLNDGSNANTGVYSSAYIKPQGDNYGVQVQIVTPQNITQVSPATYQNAAITAGAKNVLVRIATVTSVTGEGALAGVYALLEESGVTLNPTDIAIANTEITLINNIHNNVTINNYTVNKLMSNIKIQIIEQKNLNVNISSEQINIIVINNLQQLGIDAQLNNELLQQLIDFANQFASTSASDNIETIDQLELSIKGNNWAEILANQEGSMTFDEALQLERPDYSDAEAYHPIIPAMLNELYKRLENEENAIDIYSHTFIFETLLPQLSLDELDALNYIRALIYQVQASFDEERIARGMNNHGVQLTPIKENWLRSLNLNSQLSLEPALYELIQRVAISTGYAPEVYTYMDWQQDDSGFGVKILNNWSATPGVIGDFLLDMETYEVYMPVLGTGPEAQLPSVFDFEEVYGVDVESQAIEAPIPSDYQVPEEETYLQEHDEPFIEDLPEEEPSIEEPVEEISSDESVISSGENVSESSSVGSEIIDESVEVSSESSSEAATEDEVDETPSADMPDFNQSWKEVLQDSEVNAVMSTEEIEAMEMPDYSDATSYHPIIPALYSEFNDVVRSRTQPQVIMSHSFIYEEMTPNIKAEEKAALNQLRWLSFQYFLNEFDSERRPEYHKHNLPYRDELIRRVDVYESLDQDPNMKEIYMKISLTSGFHAYAYAIETDLLELEEQFYQVFYFWLDGYPPTSYPSFYYSFSDGSVGNLGLGNYLDPIQPFDFAQEYGVPVVNNYQPSMQIQLTSEVQQRMQELESSSEVEETSSAEEVEMSIPESSSVEEQIYEEPASSEVIEWEEEVSESVELIEESVGDESSY